MSAHVRRRRRRTRIAGIVRRARNHRAGRTVFRIALALLIGPVVLIMIFRFVPVPLTVPMPPQTEHAHVHLSTAANCRNISRYGTVHQRPTFVQQRALSLEREIARQINRTRAQLHIRTLPLARRGHCGITEQAGADRTVSFPAVSAFSAFVRRRNLFFMYRERRRCASGTVQLRRSESRS